eukprot:TRINITY_DN5968_c0_g1_i2.p1 TRINITY_DN5968_c0_g1~~TRINITY_DN5968_c0_g1_i2.p1  ORF type:complete len:135 (+),score=6.43 TRINITY_DN5968_c0_g1_i2:189-593(+)
MNSMDKRDPRRARPYSAIVTKRPVSSLAKFQSRSLSAPVHSSNYNHSHLYDATRLELQHVQLRKAGRSNNAIKLTQQNPVNSRQVVLFDGRLIVGHNIHITLDPTFPRFAMVVRLSVGLVVFWAMILMMFCRSS